MSFSLLRYDEEKFNDTLKTEIKGIIDNWCNQQEKVTVDDLILESDQVGPKIRDLFKTRTDFRIRHLIVVKAPVNSGQHRVFPSSEKPKDRYVPSHSSQF